MISLAGALSPTAGLRKVPLGSYADITDRGAEQSSCIGGWPERCRQELARITARSGWGGCAPTLSPTGGFGRGAARRLRPGAVADRGYGQGAATATTPQRCAPPTRGYGQGLGLGGWRPNAVADRGITRARCGCGSYAPTLSPTADSGKVQLQQVAPRGAMRPDRGCGQRCS